MGTYHLFVALSFLVCWVEGPSAQRLLQWPWELHHGQHDVALRVRQRLLWTIEEAFP